MEASPVWRDPEARQIMTRAGIFAALIAGGLVFSAAAQATEPDDAAFLKEAIQGNIGEVKVGGLAQQNGSSKAVKDFGAMLEKDHAAANKKAAQIAKTIDVVPPQMPTAEQQSVYKKLSALKGAEFDAQFIDDMIEDHQKDIAKYDEKAKGASSQASRYAADTLPDLRKHLAMAQKIQTELKSAPSASR
jgi:putative membrane protein